MNCSQILASPYNQELTLKTGTGATITAALSAIAVTAGVLALLATQGVHLGPLNALSAVGVPGASVLAGLGGLVLIATAVWFLQKAKERRGISEEEIDTSTEEEIDTGVTEEDEMRLASLFLEKGGDDTKTVTFKSLMGEKSTLNYKLETTYDDARKKMALLVNYPYQKLRFIYAGKQVDSESWATIQTGSDVHWVMRYTEK